MHRRVSGRQSVWPLPAPGRRYTSAEVVSIKPNPLKAKDVEVAKQAEAQKVTRVCGRGGGNLGTAAAAAQGVVCSSERCPI
jgi:hypothetical protein